MRRKIEHIIWIAAFLTILGSVPVAGFIFGYKADNIENRVKATFPEFSKDSLSVFPRKFELWLNDEFAFRDQYYRLYSLTKVYALHTSPKPHQVELGEGDWLYYTDEKVMDNYRCLDLLSNSELQLIIDKLTARAAWCKAHNIIYAVVFCPNKHTIYPEYLPSCYKKLQSKSRTDQLVAVLSGMEGLAVVDLRKHLSDSRSESYYPLFLTHDTHWNDLGSYFAYQHLISSINLCFSDSLETRKGFEFHEKEIEGGDLAKMIGLSSMRETAPVLMNAQDFHCKSDSTKEARLAFMNVAVSVYNDPHAPNHRKLLMLHDSFGKGLRQYLKTTFTESSFIWDQHFNEELITKESPDIIIHEFVERYTDRLAW
ncbi:MAG: hypothetical protein KKA07_04925 [Bacteroidetes bacterium]|nr:hypothetical protein [Bacteroidota bacterium]